MEARSDFASNSTSKFIVTCDDFGMHPSVNIATVELLSRKLVSRASLMTVGRYCRQAIAMLKSVGIKKIGLHLTLTSEYRNFPYFSLSQPSRQLPADWLTLSQEWSQNEIVNEIDAQIDKIYNYGLDLTHIDGHMFFYEEEGPENWCEKAVAARARHACIPLRTSHGEMNRIFIWEDIDEFDTRVRYYRTLFEDPPPGLYEVIIHPAANAASMTSFTSAAHRRVADYTYFSSSHFERIAAKVLLDPAVIASASLANSRKHPLQVEPLMPNPSNARQNSSCN